MTAMLQIIWKTWAVEKSSWVYILFDVWNVQFVFWEQTFIHVKKTVKI